MHFLTYNNEKILFDRKYALKKVYNSCWKKYIFNIFVSRKFFFLKEYSDYLNYNNNSNFLSFVFIQNGFYLLIVALEIFFEGAFKRTRRLH